MSKKKYAWANSRTDEIWSNGPFDSVAACIADAKAQGKGIETRIAIGICQNYVPHVDCDALLDEIHENAMDECGDIAENFPEFNKGYANIDSLQEKMDRALNEWLAETNQALYCITPLADMYEVK